MKGAKTEPSANKSKPPMSTIMMIIGKSQSFFLLLKNSQNSFMKSIVGNQNWFLNDSGSGPGGILSNQYDATERFFILKTSRLKSRVIKAVGVIIIKNMNPKTIGFTNLAISIPNLYQYKFKTLRVDGIARVKTRKMNAVIKSDKDQNMEKFTAP